MFKRGDTWSNETLVPHGNGEAAAGQWITVKDYGSGALPVFDGGTTTTWGVQFPSTNRGGWWFENLQMQRFTTAGIDEEFGSPFGGWAQGLRVKNCVFDGITGGAVSPATTPGSFIVMPTGLYTYQVENLTVDGTEFKNSDASFDLCSGRNVLIDHVYAHDLNIQGAGIKADYGHGAPYSGWITQTRNITVQDSTFLRTSFNGFSQGAAGLQIIGANTSLVTRNEFGFTFSPNGIDGMGLDLESGDYYTTVTFNNIHDNADAGMLFNENGALAPIYQNVGSVITDNTFNNNGLKNTGQAAVYRGQPTALDNIIFRRNVVTYAASHTFLFSVNGTGLTNSCRANYTCDGTNSVTNGSPATW